MAVVSRASLFCFSCSDYSLDDEYAYDVMHPQRF